LFRADREGGLELRALGALAAFDFDVLTDQLPRPAVVYRRAAQYVDKLLKGAIAENLPVEQPTKFDLFVNLKTAKTLGLTIPLSVQVRADKMIE
jgi:ABC-type uncharacterized transport system substrate-binding protein